LDRPYSRLGKIDKEKEGGQKTIRRGIVTVPLKTRKEIWEKESD